MTTDTFDRTGVSVIAIDYDERGTIPQQNQPPKEYLAEMRDWAINYLAPQAEINDLIEIITEAWKEGRKGREGLIAGLVAEKEELCRAIAKHAAQKADDRCWLDDVELYKAAGITEVDNHVGDKFEMLKNCTRYIEKRCEGGKWPTYAEIEAGLQKASYVLETMEQTINGYRDVNLKQAEKITELYLEIDKHKDPFTYDDSTKPPVHNFTAGPDGLCDVMVFDKPAPHTPLLRRCARVGGAHEVREASWGTKL